MSLIKLPSSSPHNPACGGQGAGAEVDLDVEVVTHVGGDVLHLVLGIDVGRTHNGDSHCVAHQWSVIDPEIISNTFCPISLSIISDLSHLT